jgi:hypothetical protein
VGTREPSDEGQARARKLGRHLVESDFTVVSGRQRVSTRLFIKPRLTPVAGLSP